MKRENRVRKHSDFDRIIQKGAAVKGRRFSIHYERGDVEETHIGIAVGKRNGGAVARVKAKRQIRAMIAECWNDYCIPLNLVIVVRPSYDSSDFVASKQELTELLTMIKESQH